MLKKHISFLILSRAAAPYSPSVWNGFSSCLFKVKSALIGQLTHTWAGTANKIRAAVLNQLPGAKLAVALIMQMYDMVT